MLVEPSPLAKPFTRALELELGPELVTTASTADLRAKLERLGVHRLALIQPAQA